MPCIEFVVFVIRWLVGWLVCLFGGVAAALAAIQSIVIL